MTCTRCQGEVFLNTHKLPEDVAHKITLGQYDKITEWIRSNKTHDVRVCDCCGNVEDWYDVPGQHYNNDIPGEYGPYAYNGGKCECH